MKLPHAKLRLPIAFLFGSLIIGGSLFQFSLDHRVSCEMRLISEQSKAEQAARAVREAPTRLNQVQEESELFQQIEHSGFIGPEDRINWVSELAKIQSRLDLNSLSWHIAAQSPSNLAVGLHFSSMEFTASPINANSLTELLSQLQQNAHGRYTVEYCHLTFDSNYLHGQAHCGLNWWTLAPTED